MGTSVSRQIRHAGSTLSLAKSLARSMQRELVLHENITKRPERPRAFPQRNELAPMTEKASMS